MCRYILEGRTWAWGSCEGLGMLWAESFMTKHIEKEFAELCTYSHSAKWQVHIWLGEAERFKELECEWMQWWCLLWFEQNGAVPCTHETTKGTLVSHYSSVYAYDRMHAPGNALLLMHLFSLLHLLKEHNLESFPWSESLGSAEWQGTGCPYSVKFLTWLMYMNCGLCKVIYRKIQANT